MSPCPPGPIREYLLRLRDIQYLAEKREIWDIRPRYQPEKAVAVLIGPSRGGLLALLRGSEPDTSAVRGCFFPSDGLHLVWLAGAATHAAVEDHLGRADESAAIGGNLPFSGRYYVSLSPDGDPVFIGHPDVVFTHLPAAARLFSRIDQPALPVGRSGPQVGSRLGLASNSWRKAACCRRATP